MYYTKKEFDLLIKYKDQLGNKQHEAYEPLKDAYEKTETLCNEVAKLVFKDKGIVKITKKPTNQAQRFIHYNWGQVYPTLEDKQFGKIAFTIGIDGGLGFVVKIDLITNKVSAEEREDYENFRGDYLGSEIVNYLTIEQTLNMDFDELVYYSDEFVKSHLDQYYEIKEKLLGINNNDIKNKTYLRYNNYPKNQILYGPPGTGKTFNVIHKALEIIDGDGLEEDREAAIKAFNDYVWKKQIVFTTFHQSFSYEDFVEGIKPNVNDDTGGILSYSVEKGIFRQICEDSLSDDGIEKFIEDLKLESNEDDNKTPIVMKTKSTEFSVTYRGGKTFRIKPHNSDNEKEYYASIENILKVYQKEIGKWDVYNASYVSGILSYFEEKGLSKFDSNKTENIRKVLIIDEINRGNVSSIFGELITLIEDDKRLGAENALKVKLPYSKKDFGVPSNLYILGTMNTADRSVEALDSALRRRFNFVEMPPIPDLIKELDEIEEEEKKGYIGNINLVELLKTINKRIEILLDRDHLIGHSYFLGIKTLGDLKISFSKQIIPLLQEYFYGDYGKISLVLGEGFCSGEKIRSNVSSIFAKSEFYDVSPYEEKIIYTIKDNFSDDETFIEAINLLLNNTSNETHG